MKALQFLSMLALVAAGIFFGVDTASAQATRTWVSGVGDDVNPCSRTAPCKTFAGAISKTAAGGEINCLDPGGFGTVTITKSITLDCTGTFGSILASSTNGVNVNDSATATPNTINVVLRGLSINGAPPATPGLNGIRFVSGKSLRVEDVVIFNFTSTAVGNGNGILVNPALGGTKNIIVNNTKIYNTGSAAGGAGIFIGPTGAVSVNLILTNSSVDNNNFVGIRIRGNSTTGNVNGSISDTSASGNVNEGVLVEETAPGATNVGITRLTATGNLFGVKAASPAVATVGSSIITGNNTGVSGNVTSYGNNQLAGNTVASAPGPVGLQGGRP